MHRRATTGIISDSGTDPIDVGPAFSSPDHAALDKRLQQKSSNTPFGWKDPLMELEPMWKSFGTPRCLPLISIGCATVAVFTSLITFYSAEHSLEDVCKDKVSSTAECDNLHIPSLALLGVNEPEYYVMAVGFTLTASSAALTNLYLFLALKDRIRTFKKTYTNLYNESLGCFGCVCPPLLCSWPPGQMHVCNSMQFGVALVMNGALAVAGWIDIGSNAWVYAVSMSIFVGLHVVQNFLLVRLQITLNVHPTMSENSSHVWAKSYRFTDLPKRTQLKTVTGIGAFCVVVVCGVYALLDDSQAFYGYVLPLCEWFGYILFCISVGTYYFDIYRAGISWSGYSKIMVHNLTSAERLESMQYERSRRSRTSNEDVEPTPTAHGADAAEDNSLGVAAQSNTFVVEAAEAEAVLSRADAEPQGIQGPEVSKRVLE
eukprot:TRINITY_DN11638_c0_g1_i2.p1 TRINITY_DN11638_c0_g1~~TRINITY_DN11638_c0_g1_i2.p1  ORF type:complete len:430 (+),score=82.70 TRINITY_DN11638_c0_g1_i2:82-1371(+)